MLRWIAILAVVINVIYFSVRYSSAPESVVSQNNPSADPSAAQLVMLSERKSIVDDVKNRSNNVSEIVKEDTPEEKVAVVEAQEEVPYQESAINQPVAVDEKDKSDEQQKSPSVTEVVSEASSTCWDIGKFSTEASAKQLQERLAVLGETLMIQKRSVAGEPDYWVFLGPYDNRRQALAAHRDMQARKIDSFLIAEGELENAVSLGLFSLETGAQKMLQQRKKQGLDAKMRAVPRMRNEWWATINYAKGPLPDSIREIISSVQDDPALEIKTLACESIANTKKLD